MLSDIHPLMAITLCGDSPSRSSEGLSVECPSCSGRLMVVRGSFVCASSGCSFARGGALDYMRLKLGSYEKALEVAGEVSPHLLENLAGGAEILRRHRTLLEFFIEAEAHNTSADVERLVLRTDYSNSFKTPTQAFNAGHLFITPEESDRLVLLLTQVDVTPPSNLQGRAVSLSPYWAHPHILGHLVATGRGPRDTRVVEVFPHRYSWFGMNQMSASCSRVAVMPSCPEAMRAESTFRKHRPDVFPTHLLVNVGAPDKGTVFESVEFHGNPRSWYSTLQASSLYEDFDNSDFYDAEAGQSDIQTLMLRLMATADTEDFDEFLDLCAATKLDTATRSALASRALDMRDQQQAARFRSSLTRRLLDRTEKHTLYESSSGYLIEVAGSERSVTNFTLDITDSVAFSQNSEILYNGRMTLGSRKMPFTMQGGMFDSPAAVEKLLAHTQSSHPKVEGEERPTYQNKTDFQKILTWLKAKTAKLPWSKGTHGLGWSLRCDTFSTPDFRVLESGETEPVAYHVPADAPDHDCFRTGNLRLGIPETLPTLDSDLAELVSVMVAQMIRFYLGHKVRPIPVQNSAATRRKALKLFEGLGQYKVLRLTNTFPGNLHVNRGLPCLMIDIKPLQAAKMQFAGLWLADKGVELDDVPDTQVDFVASCLPDILEAVASRLLKGELTSYQERRSVNLATSQAAEGAGVMRGEFWGNWPAPGVSWSALDKMLEAREDRASSLLRHANNDMVVIPSAMWEALGFNRVDLVEELGRVCTTVDVSDASDIGVDRNSMYRLLEAFYGEVPELAAQGT